MLSKLTSKGQTTVPKEVREYLNLHPGDEVKWFPQSDGSVVVLPTVDVSILRGSLKHDGPPLTLEEMDAAIVEGATRRHRKTAGSKDKAA
jgi:antitoxin PrlF